MLQAIFGKDSASSAGAHVALAGHDLQLMVDIFCRAPSLMPFTASEAKVAASYLSARAYREGAIIIEEGSRIKLDRMMWLLQGEATFEALAGKGPGKPVTVRVLGPGSELGTMSMFDGEPRALRSTATEASRCALLTRDQLRALSKEHPQVSSKLMAVVCLNFALALRELTTKLKCHVRLNNTMHEELMGKDAANVGLE